MDSARMGKAEILEFADEFQDDLLAVFSALEDDIGKMLDKAEREKWTPERLITEVDNLLLEAGDEPTAPGR